MANWDFVFPYDSRATEWLEQQGLPHPSARPGNRLPSSSEVEAVWRRHDPNELLRIEGFDWGDASFVPEDAFKLNGELLVALRVLVDLAASCGQFWLYPDTGEPAIVVEASLDVVRTEQIYSEVREAPDSWEQFHRAVYSGALSPESR